MNRETTNPKDKMQLSDKINGWDGSGLEIPSMYLLKYNLMK